MSIHDMTLMVGLTLVLIGLAAVLLRHFTIPLLRGLRIRVTGDRAVVFGFISLGIALLVLFPLAAPYTHIGTGNLSAYAYVPTPGTLLASIVLTVFGFAVCYFFEPPANRDRQNKHFELILPQQKLHELDEPLLPIEDIPIQEGMSIRLGDDGELIFEEKDAKDQSSSV